MDEKKKQDAAQNEIAEVYPPASEAAVEAVPMPPPTALSLAAPTDDEKKGQNEVSGIFPPDGEVVVAAEPMTPPG